MFNMMRAYLSRGKTQAFVNVLSENYLLRDYMRCNRQMFMSDPNAVPSLVPDYAKTERNTILKLLLTMVIHPVSDDEVLQELHLAGIETDDAFDTLGKLLCKYTFADSSVLRFIVFGQLWTNSRRYLPVFTQLQMMPLTSFLGLFEKRILHSGG